MSCMRVKLSLLQQGLVLVCIPVVFELLFIGVFCWLLTLANQEIQIENQRKTLVIDMHKLSDHFYVAARSAVLYGMGSKGYESTYTDAISSIENTIPKISEQAHALTAQDPTYDAVERRYKGLETLKSFKAQVELNPQQKRVFNPDMEHRLRAYLTQ